MNQSRSINQAIIEELYTEALMLADEARAAFDMRGFNGLAGAEQDPGSVRIALSIEGLRTTTRIMHILAWLLNQRAFLAGELTERQLRRHGALPEERPSDPAQTARLEPETRALILQSEQLHRRVARLDHDWRSQDTDMPSPVQDMHGKISRAFAAN